MVRYDPFEDLRKVQEAFDRTFDSYWTNIRKRAALGPGKEAPLGEFTSPAIEVQALEDKYIIKADLPGIDKKDVHVKVQDDSIIISAETSTATEKGDAKKGNYYCERYYGSYYREVPLAAPVDEAHATAVLENGVLTLELPKKALAASSTQEIAIK